MVSVGGSHHFNQSMRTERAVKIEVVESRRPTTDEEKIAFIEALLKSAWEADKAMWDKAHKELIIEWSHGPSKSHL